MRADENAGGSATGGWGGSGHVGLGGRSPHGVLEVAAEIVHIASEFFGELEFHCSDLEKTRGSVLVELVRRSKIRVALIGTDRGHSKRATISADVDVWLAVPTLRGETPFALRRSIIRTACD